MTSARASLSAGNSSDASSLLAFLASAKEAVAGFTAPAPAAHDRAALLPHVYFGNEAGDADSLVSPLCYAYLQAELSARGRLSGTTSAAPGEEEAAYAHVPLLSISRADLALRPEVAALFEVAGLAGTFQSDALICHDDPAGGTSTVLSLLATFSAGSRATLLDHNALAPKLIEAVGPDFAANRAYGVVDHHADQGLYLEAVPLASPRRVVAFAGGAALAGSACTLVAEAFLRAEADLAAATAAADALRPQGSTEARADGTVSAKPPPAAAPPLAGPAVATLLCGVILLDTMNMSAAAGKGTARDAAALAALLPRCLVGRGALFPTLQAAKFDPQWWGSLTAAQALAYDYKQAEVVGAAEGAAGSTMAAPSDALVYGVASVLVSVPDLVAKRDFYAACDAFMQQRRLKLLAVMALVTEPSPGDGSSSSESGSGGGARRELLLVARSADGLAAAVAAFAAPSAAAGQALGLSPLTAALAPAPQTSSSSRGTIVLAAFAQAALKQSRKQAMPLLHAALEANPTIAARL